MVAPQAIALHTPGNAARADAPCIPRPCCPQSMIERALRDKARGAAGGLLLSLDVQPNDLLEVFLE